MKLSLCIASYNEENNIHYPLDSALDLVDEVIIVDGGSTDKTIKVAQNYGNKVKVFKEKYVAMFHINKQKAIERAKGDWILQLDADEALSEELREEIRQIINSKSEARNSKQIKNPNDQNSKRFKHSNLKNSDLFRDSNFDIRDFVAYWIPRKNFFLSRFLTKGGQYPDYTIRLYKNGSAHFPCKSVHENVAVKGKIGYLKNPILHFADPNFSRYLKRWNRYTQLDAMLLLKEGKKPNVVDYLIIKPTSWFFSTYFRHLGFVDGIPGLIFSFFSAFRFWKVYFNWRLLSGKPKINRL